MKPYFNNSNIPITMKTFKFILLLFLTTFIVSCSSDDDSNNAPKGYFPTQINATGFTNTNNNLVIDIEYNVRNDISKITFTDGLGDVNTKTYTYTNGRVTQVDNNGFLGGPDTRTFIYDESGHLSSIIDENDSGSETFPLTYNSATNTYTLTDGSDTFSITLDTTDNPQLYSSSFFPDLTITLDDTNSGVFKNVAPQVALQFDLTLFNSGHLLYFLNQKQINRYEFGVQDFDVINSRNEEDNITVVDYNFVGESIQLNITYQQRNL